MTRDEYNGVCFGTTYYLVAGGTVHTNLTAGIILGWPEREVKIARSARSVFGSCD